MKFLNFTQKSWVRKIFGFGLASFFSDFSHEMTVSLVPILVTQFVGVTQAPFYLGLISSFTDAFASFLRLISGFISDRLPRKKPLIIAGYAVATLFSTLVGFARSVWGILVYRTLSFTGSGLREPPRDALIAATIERENYGRAFGLRNAMDTLGSLVGPLVAFACAGFFSVREIFVLAAIPGILSVLAILFFTQDIPVKAQKPRVSPTFWKDFLLLPRPFAILVGILFIFDLSCFNKLLLLARIQEILVGSTISTAQVLIILYAIFNLIRAASELLIGLLSDFVNRILLLALFGCGTFAAVALLLMRSQASFLYCVLIMTLAGISAATLLTLKKACAADMLPAEIRGFGYGVLQASEGFAALISNMLIGFLWTRYSPILSFSYVSLLSIGAAILLLVFVRSRNTISFLQT